jgi:hypothetical protein
MRALKFIGSIFIGSICISFFFGVGETLVWAIPIRAFKSMGRAAPRRFSLWGYSAFRRRRAD